MAFQANNGSLYNYGDAGITNTNQGMQAGTSPSIAELSTGRFESAFQANTGVLIAWGSAGSNYTGQGMYGGTSPSIAGVGSGTYEMAFEANTASCSPTGLSAPM